MGMTEVGEKPATNPTLDKIMEQAQQLDAGLVKEEIVDLDAEIRAAMRNVTRLICGRPIDGTSRHQKRGSRDHARRRRPERTLSGSLAQRQVQRENKLVRGAYQQTMMLIRHS